jgi:hypothetical protein
MSPRPPFFDAGIVTVRRGGRPLNALMVSARTEKSLPQRLKPLLLRGVFGTAKAVP